MGSKKDSAGKGGKAKKKKPAAAEGATASSAAPATPDVDPQVFVAKARDLKEVGNREFQSRDFKTAHETYGAALALLPANHADRAVLHSNRAACLLQMKPVAYREVVTECQLALAVQPGFVRALLRRSRAYEALGELHLAQLDLREILKADPTNQDASDLFRRVLRNSMKPPPANGVASAVKGRGPVLPERPPAGTKKAAATVGQDTLSSSAREQMAEEKVRRAKKEQEEKEREEEEERKRQRVMQRERQLARQKRRKERAAAKAAREAIRAAQVAKEKARYDPKVASRIKLVLNGQDVRIATLPQDCRFSELRDAVKSSFAHIGSFQMKYIDLEGDLVTITDASGIRAAEVTAVALAEAAPTTIAQLAASAAQQAFAAAHRGSLGAASAVTAPVKPGEVAVADKVATPAQDSERPARLLRLYVVEVAPGQEPPIPEEDRIAATELAADDVSEEEEEEDEEEVEEEMEEEKEKGAEVGEEGDIMFDDWILDFAALFRQKLGVNPEVTLELQEIGLEKAIAALDQAVLAEEAQPLFEQALAKSRDMVAIVSLHEGNIWYTMARRRRFLFLKAVEESESLAASKGEKEEAKSAGTGGGPLDEEERAVREDVERLLVQAVKKFDEALTGGSAGTLDLLWEAQALHVAVEAQSQLAKVQEERIVAGGTVLEDSPKALEEVLETLQAVEVKTARGAEVGAQLVKQEELHLQQLAASEAAPDVSGPAHSPGEGEADGEGGNSIDEYRRFAKTMTLLQGQTIFDCSQMEYKLGRSTWQAVLDKAVAKLREVDFPEEEIEGFLAGHTAKQQPLPTAEAQSGTGEGAASSTGGKSEGGPLEEEQVGAAADAAVTVEEPKESNYGEVDAQEEQQLQKVPVIDKENATEEEGKDVVKEAAQEGAAGKVAGEPVSKKKKAKGKGGKK